MNSQNGHRLVLFDIDGTLLSAGRAARQSILATLREVYGWEGSAESNDFSGKTDPQIVRELVAESIGRERCEVALERALDCYVAELARQLQTGTVVPKPGIPELLVRLAREPRVTLALLTGNLERSARLKLAPPGFNPYFPFGAFGSDSSDRYELPVVAIERARRHCGVEFSGKSVVVIGDSVHDVACGRSLGVRSIAVATGVTSPERLSAENPDALFPDLQDTDAAVEAILR